MSSFRKLAAFGLLWLTFAAVAFSSPIATNLTVVDWNYPILNGGRFGVELNAGTEFNAFCVDYQNIIHAYNTPYSAYVSTAGDISMTRYGTTAISGFNYAGSTPLSALDRYTMAAWLTTQFTFPAGGATADDQGIQTAIWTLLSQATAAPPTSPDQATVNKWLTNAIQFKLGSPAGFSAVQSEMRIVTTSDVAGAENRYHSGQQEYIFVTPEPATYLMIGTGLIALAFRRRKRA